MCFFFGVKTKLLQKSTPPGLDRNDSSGARIRQFQETSGVGDAESEMLGFSVESVGGPLPIPSMYLHIFTYTLIP